MKRKFWLRQLPLALLIGFVVTIASAQNGSPRTQSPGKDTVPSPNKKVKDIDEALDQLEMSRGELDKTLRELDFQSIEKQIRESLKNLQIDSEKMKAEMDAALKNLDAAKIQLDATRALKDADFDKLLKELSRELKGADMERARSEMDKALKQLDMEKLHAQIEASIAGIDKEKLRAEMEKIKSVEMEQLHTEMEKLRPELERSMQEAHKSMEKARTELTAYKNFINGLERDGLIDKNKNYTIEYKNGVLTINGKKQPASVVSKYGTFLKDRKDFTLKKDENDFQINND
jgi:HSP20 family molecular chaperone IbpA